jgi:transposase
MILAIMPMVMERNSASRTNFQGVCTGSRGTKAWISQPGKHEGKGRITKRGNRHLWKIIWLMTTKVIQYTDTSNVYYLKRRKEGLPYKMAVLATAHKLIRVIYAMLTHRTTFCAQVNS